MGPRTAGQTDNSAAVAAQFGTSLKALRLYEQLGMLKPARTRAGWRVYGVRDIERLHAILSLKQLGLPLARIAELLKTGKSDLGVLLAVQEEMLLRSRLETDHALTLIRVARARLAGNEKLTGEELAAMVRRIEQTVLRWTPELEELALKTYTPEQMLRLRAAQTDTADAARTSQVWEEVMARLDGLIAAGDPHCDEALDVGRRLFAMFREFSGGDKEMWNSSARFWEQAVSDPTIAGQIGLDSARFAFVGEVLKELQHRGEMTF